MTRLQKPAPLRIASGASQAHHDGNAASDDSNTQYIPASIEKAQQSFLADLASLLLKCPGQWVAYHGAKRVGIGRDERLLYERCFRRGLSREQFIVRRVAAETPIPDVTPLLGGV